MSLPLLSSRFFTQHKPSLNFWVKWSTIEKWSTQIVPLYEWENILYVGVIDEIPPAGISTHCIFVRCEAEQLKSYFLSMQKPLATPKIPTPASPRLDVDPFASLGKSMGLAKDDDKTVFKLDISDLTVAESELRTLEKTGDVVEALDLEVMQAPLPPIPKEETLASIQMTKTKINPPPAGLSGEGIAEKIFKQMTSHFVRSMLLRREGNALKPWKWDANFHPRPEAKENLISLGTPSPFRIAARTLKPYHGYVVSNEVNEKFFDEWNQTHIPDHLTVMPIVRDDQVVAMLVGFAEKSVNQRASLVLVEKLSEELEQAIQENPTAFAS